MIRALAQLRHAVPLTGRGVGVLVLAVVLVAGGLASGWLPLVGVGAALLVLVVLDVVTVWGDRRLTVRRTVEPLVVWRGQPVDSHLVTTAPRTRLPVQRTVVDTVAGEEVEVDLPGLDAGSAAATTPIPTTRRGLLSVGPLRIASTGATGLAGRSALLGDVVLVRVLPRPVAVRSLPRGSRRAATGQDERVERGGTDLVGLHEYVPGDDLRRLHWASSARIGTLMVRDDADPSEPHVLVLLDDRAPSYGASVETDFEEAVDFCAGLVERALADGRHVRLQTLSGQVDVEVEARRARAGSTPDPRIGHALAEVATVDAAHVASVSSRDRDIVVLVTGAGHDAAEALNLLAGATTPVVAVLEPTPARPFGSTGGVVSVHAASAQALAGVFEVAVS